MLGAVTTIVSSTKLSFWSVMMHVVNTAAVETEKEVLARPTAGPSRSARSSVRSHLPRVERAGARPRTSRRNRRTVFVFIRVFLRLIPVVWRRRWWGERWWGERKQGVVRLRSRPDVLEASR